MRLAPILFVLACSVALAQSQALRFSTALQKATEASAEVRTAALELDAATRELTRVEADPLGLRVNRLQAQHAFERAESSLRAARLQAQDSAASAYAEVLQAEDDLALAELRHQIAATELEATRIRFEAGAATSLDVARAENAFEASARDLSEAEQARALAYDRLSSLLAEEVRALEPGLPTSELPPYDVVAENLTENMQLMQALQAQALREAELEAVDNAFSARADIEAAQDGLETAEVTVAETRRSLELSLRQSYNAALAARDRVESAEAELATAQEDLTAQQLRFEAGSISQLALQRAEADLRAGAVQLAEARAAFAAAIRQLELTTLGAP